MIRKQFFFLTRAIRMDVLPLGPSRVAPHTKRGKIHPKKLFWRPRTARRQQDQSTDKSEEKEGNAKATPQESCALPSFQLKTTRDMDYIDAQNPITSQHKPAPFPYSWSWNNSVDLPLNDRSTPKPDFDDVVHGREHPEPAERMLSEELAEQGLLPPAPAPSELLARYYVIEDPTGPSNFFGNTERPDVRHSVFNNVRGCQINVNFGPPNGLYYLVLSVLIIVACLAAAICVIRLT